MVKDVKVVDVGGECKLEAVCLRSAWERSGGIWGPIEGTELLDGCSCGFCRAGV